MQILTLIYNLLIGPLELVFEIIYVFAFRILDNPGLAIIFLSLAMNFLVLPLYKRADAMQEQERKKQQQLKPWTNHIKKTFSGDERFMMLQTLNRQNNAKPTDALKGSLSLLLEIPFFIAAFHFLSNLELLNGASFGPLVNLGAPDGLCLIGGTVINVLPILMTLINLLSAAIYMKGMPLSNKVQMIAIAGIFLILLYNSPSGLVFYWTLNNIFSLCKNIAYRIKDVRTSTTNLGKQAFPTTTESSTSSSRAFIINCLFLAVLTGAFIPVTIVQSSPAEFVTATVGQSPLWYTAESFALALGLFGIWFSVFYRLATPKGKTVFSSLLFAFTGVGLLNYLFFGTSYGNLSPQLSFESSLNITTQDAIINIAVAIIATICLLLLQHYKKRLADIAVTTLCLATILMCGISALNTYKSLAETQELLATSGSSVPTEKNDVATNSTTSETQNKEYANSPHITLSATGQNVIVIMLDRAISYYIPYIFEEKPELAKQFQGFTYYPNTISYGTSTNFGTPCLYGGYDYTPEKINERSNESLKDKQNEALKVMPSIFSTNNFDVTVFDPTYANYSWVPDISIFNNMPNVKAYITMDGQFSAIEETGPIIANTEQLAVAGNATDSDPKIISTPSLARNFFCYSLFKTAPVLIQPLVYNNGKYNSAAILSMEVDAANKIEALTAKSSESIQEDTQQQGTALVIDGATTNNQWTEDLLSGQIRENASIAMGASPAFMRSYAVLRNLSTITSIEQNSTSQFFMMSNDTTHEPMVLAEPAYKPEPYVDNTNFDNAHRTRSAESMPDIYFPEESADNGKSKIMHYQINVAALTELGNWFDYLRENNVFDNTKIILVSDHGRQLFLDNQLIEVIDNTEEFDVLAFNCLLMVKDFNSIEYATDSTFMTNADVPAIACKDLIETPINPFTDNAINTSNKNSAKQIVFYSPDWDIETNNGNKFLPGYWFAVERNIFDKANWEYLGNW